MYLDLPLLVSVVLLTKGPVNVVGNGNFTYNIMPDSYNGVYNWHRTYEEGCAGYEQSPVNVQTSRVRYNPDFRCPGIYFANGLISGRVENTGHTVRFVPANAQSMSISGAPYRPDRLLSKGFHIHHGGVYGRGLAELEGPAAPGTLRPGSEHTIDGYRYDGEVHFVFSNGQGEPVVVAIFVQVLPDWRVQDMRFSSFLEAVIPSVTSINDTAYISVDPGMFFGSDCAFFTYPGSKTTPSCGEYVRWIIFRRHVVATQSAWYQLSRTNSRGGFVSRYGNYRNVQPLNERLVETNIVPEVGQYPTNVAPDVVQYPTNIAPDVGQYPTNVAPDVDQYPTNIAPDVVQYPTNIASDVVQYPTNIEPDVGQYPTNVAPEVGQFPTNIVRAMRNPSNIASDVDQYPNNIPSDVGQFPTDFAPEVGQYPANNIQDIGQYPTNIAQWVGPYPASPNLAQDFTQRNDGIGANRLID